jgi:hypothetical protein
VTKAGLTLGRIGQNGAGPTRFAERAVAIVAALGTDERALLALHRETGRVSLHDHEDDLPPALYFFRGVSRISDPDDLADDLMSEGVECGLLAPKNLREQQKRRNHRAAREAQ